VEGGKRVARRWVINLERNILIKLLCISVQNFILFVEGRCSASGCEARDVGRVDIVHGSYSW
jgi:hypothetical protein